MAEIDPQAAQKMQPELLSGESIYWAGMPDPGTIFHSDDWAMIPFSLAWGGFAIFWESMVLGAWGNGPKGSPPTFFALWGIPFILIGQYMIWGRFIYDGWLKRRTYYAVTNRRILVLQEGWKRKSSSMLLSAIPTIERDGTDKATFWFGPKFPLFAGRGQQSRAWSLLNLGAVPVFADINDADSVYRLILELQDKSRKESSQTNFG